MPRFRPGQVAVTFTGSKTSACDTQVLRYSSHLEGSDEEEGQVLGEQF